MAFMPFITHDYHDQQLVIILNRPEALNALNHDMVLAVTELLENHRDDDRVTDIIFKGAGDRAFCAGGDVKAVYYKGLEDYETACTYFRDEYRMNKIMHHYPKPITSYCHGFVMGGGYGIAGNGRHIIVDDTIRFAMPETAIGFFPDVGIGWRLARAGALGMYIALTGDIFDADMMMAAGLATAKKGEVTDIQNAQDIEKHFSFKTLEGVFQSLERDDGAFAQQTLKILQARSPLSLHITFHHLTMAATEDFDTVIDRDYRLACAFFAGEEVYEGIRAQLVDKDKKPRWGHASIDEVPQEVVDSYLNFRNNK